jgi:hypothetical protein
MIAFAPILLPMRRIASTGGTDEDEAGGGDALGEVGILGEEAVPRMDRVGARRACGFEDAVDLEIRLATRRRSDAHRFVRLRDVRRVLVGVGVHGDAREPHRPHGAEHPPGDLAAVRDEHFPNPRRHAAALLAGRATPCQCARSAAQPCHPPWASLGSSHRFGTTRHASAVGRV